MAVVVDRPSQPHDPGDQEHGEHRGEIDHDRRAEKDQVQRVLMGQAVHLSSVVRTSKDVKEGVRRAGHDGHHEQIERDVHRYRTRRGTCGAPSPGRARYVAFGKPPNNTTRPAPPTTTNVVANPVAAGPGVNNAAGLTQNITAPTPRSVARVATEIDTNASRRSPVVRVRGPSPRITSPPRREETGALLKPTRSVPRSGAVRGPLGILGLEPADELRRDLDERVVRRSVDRDVVERHEMMLAGGALESDLEPGELCRLFGAQDERLEVLETHLARRERPVVAVHSGSSRCPSGPRGRVPRSLARARSAGPRAHPRKPSTGWA